MEAPGGTLSGASLRQRLCNAAVFENMPGKSLPTYGHFDQAQIVEFTGE